MHKPRNQSAEPQPTKTTTLSIDGFKERPVVKNGGDPIHGGEIHWGESSPTPPINRQVSPEYIKLKHSIQSCKNYQQLENLYDAVQMHVVKFNHEDDLMGIYLIKSGILTPILTTDEIESLHHKRTCGAH